MTAVSSTCTNKKKKMVTPVMRCRTQDHMPGSPRYRERRRTGSGATSVEVLIGKVASNIVDGRVESASSDSTMDHDKRL